MKLLSVKPIKATIATINRDSTIKSFNVDHKLNGDLSEDLCYLVFTRNGFKSTCFLASGKEIEMLKHGKMNFRYIISGQIQKGNLYKKLDAGNIGSGVSLLGFDLNSSEDVQIVIKIEREYVALSL